MEERLQKLQNQRVDLVCAGYMCLRGDLERLNRFTYVLWVGEGFIYFDIDHVESVQENKITLKKIG